MKNQRTIVLYPGYMTNKTTLAELKDRLLSDGHVVEDWTLNYNTGMSIGKFQQLRMQLLELYYRNDNNKVHIIGHSLGGTIGRAMGNIAPELVEHVITIGSPINNIREALDKLKFAQDLAHGRVSTLEEWEAYKDMVCTAPKVKCTSIWSTEDKVVPWRESLIATEDGNNISVVGAHIKLPKLEPVQDIVSKLLVDEIACMVYNIGT